MKGDPTGPTDIPLCRDNLDLFFRDDKQSIAEARAICRACPRIEGCLEEALALSHAYNAGGGVWADTTPADRRRIRAERLAAGRAN